MYSQDIGKKLNIEKYAMLMKKKKKRQRKDWFGLVWFYGTSTIIGYLMTHLFLYIWTILFQTIQYNIIIVFLFTHS